MSGRWVDLREAAELLGTSTEAVRKRATRGSLRSDRQNGRLLVWVDDGRTEGGHQAKVDGGPLVEVLRDQVADLRARLDREQEANRENRRIIAALTSRIPEIEAPTEQRQPEPEQPAPADDAREEAAEQPAQRPARVGYPPSDTEAQTGSERVSWWRRMFGG
jgi:hypothetical protein